MSILELLVYILNTKFIFNIKRNYYRLYNITIEIRKLIN